MFDIFITFGLLNIRPSLTLSLDDDGPGRTCLIHSPLISTRGHSSILLIYLFATELCGLPPLAKRKEPQPPPTNVHAEGNAEVSNII